MIDKYKEFKKELESLLNRYSIDNEMQMHDFVIAEMVVNILFEIKNANYRVNNLKEN